MEETIFFSFMNQTSEVSSTYVTFMRGANGHKMCSLSLLSCSKKTISTNKALNMKKANTDLFLSSIKSRAMRSCFYFQQTVEIFVIKFWSNFDNVMPKM